MTHARERQVAVEAVTQAAQICAGVRAEMVGAAFVQKDDRSPVTIADFSAQALICQRLSEAFPSDAIVAEEDATELRKHENAGTLDVVARYVRLALPEATRRDICHWIDLGTSQPADRFWTLDPIDGTKGFLRNDQYAVALALIEHGQVKLGALACPALPSGGAQGPGVLFVAVRGAGAFMAPLAGGPEMPIRVAYDGAARRFVESVEAGHGDHALQEAVARAAGIEQPPLRMDSQAKYGAVARGDAALYLRLPSPKSPGYRENIWDHAAGALIVEEAGGRVSDMYGAPLDFGAGTKLHANRGVVVSNGALHDAVIAALMQRSVSHPV
ncbi:MAG TPA: 3'(2'),5'-bisphosphate nucleotidase [Roseiflexaceae bacterium]|nr:3'(2'),5'-bisphosphate nucleotidase [Roseiflexaceae bacterium]